ncbi:hypothetical protein SUDANB171_00280 [Streptomyces sp. enrichment culture]|uniref:DUF4231 domain-containing protein n=1 Tax=Streptomyces sp. enrichment culture TaxID=1795815 RepID=UPI003F57D12D
MLIRRGTPPAPPGPGAGEDAVLEYALNELDWYARVRDRARVRHRGTELSALVTGAATVVAAGVQAPAAVTATLAGLTLFIGGFRQIFNDLERYVLAAEAWTRLRLATQRYRLLPEAERDEAARRLLLEQIETVATAELQGWAGAHRAAPPALRAPDQAP